jgi:TPP-dependent trihydroxycyclohexane-1,2-dione (THcHDO) dehydratase
MDIELLQQALENDDNLNIINTNIQEIKRKKNQILQELGLKREDLKSYHKKLNGYMYVDNIKDLKYGRTIRWINLNKIDAIKITNGALLCDIKIHDKGLALVLKGYAHNYITLYLNENIIFQKLNAEEEIILKAVNYLNQQNQ